MNQVWLEVKPEEFAATLSGTLEMEGCETCGHGSTVGEPTFWIGRPPSDEEMQAAGQATRAMQPRVAGFTPGRTDDGAEEWVEDVR